MKRSDTPNTTVRPLFETLHLLDEKLPEVINPTAVKISKKKASPQQEASSSSVREKTIQKKEPAKITYETRRAARRKFYDECWGVGNRDPESEQED